MTEIERWQADFEARMVIGYISLTTINASAMELAITQFMTEMLS